MTKACGTCKFHDDFKWICDNEESIKGGKETKPYEVCNLWHPYRTQKVEKNDGKRVFKTT